MPDIYILERGMDFYEESWQEIVAVFPTFEAADAACALIRNEDVDLPAESDEGEWRWLSRNNWRDWWLITRHEVLDKYAPDPEPSAVDEQQIGGFTTRAGSWRDNAR